MNSEQFVSCKSEYFSNGIKELAYIAFAWVKICLIGVVGIFILISCRSKGNTPVEAEPVDRLSRLSITAPAEIEVGTPLEIVLSGEAADGHLARLSLLGSYGIWLYEAEFNGGKARFDIPLTETTQAGFVTVIGQAGNAKAETVIDFMAGPPVEPLTPLVGPNSITADGKSWSVMTLVPFDRYANPVAEGTEVTFRVFHPGNILEEFLQDTHHLMAWSRVLSKTRSGKTFITTQIGEAYGTEVSMIQTPGWPVPFNLSNEPERVVADGLQLTHIRTSRIVDQHGNVMPDGTLVTFIMTDENGKRRQLPAQTVDGFAEIAIQAPLQPGTMEVTGTVFSVESAPLKIGFDPGPAIGVFAIDVAEGVGKNEGALVFEAGPLLGARDQYVPNSTPVRFWLVHQNGVIIEGEALSNRGYAVFNERLENLLPGQYTVNASIGTAVGKTTFLYDDEEAKVVGD